MGIFGLLANRGYTGLSLHQYAEPYFSEQLETVGAMQNPAWAASLRSDASVIAASYNKTLASCPRVKQLPLGEAGLTALWLRYGGQRTPALTEFPPRLAAPLLRFCGCDSERVSCSTCWWSRGAQGLPWSPLTPVAASPPPPKCLPTVQAQTCT